MTLRQIIKEAQDDLRDWVRENPEGDPTDEAIHEIADGSVPVYTTELLQLALDDLALAVAEPELGPAFDGTPTPANLIAANVYEAVEAALYEEWDSIQDEED